MANEWYIKQDDRVTGPFSVSQMKAQAAANRIHPETRVRKGERGRWFLASKVQGLLPTESAAGMATGTRSTENSKTGEHGTFLAPLHNRKRRAIIWVCLIAFITIGQAALYQQLIFDLTMGLIIGSFPMIEVKKKSIEQTIFVLFFPVHRNTWRMRDFVAVEAEVEPRASDQFGCLIYIFFWYAILWRCFDFLMPWLGGTYKLYLKEIDDERTLIWQGSNTSDYEANLMLFESRGLRIS